MFKNIPTHTFFNEGKVPSKNGAVILYKAQTKVEKVQPGKFIAGTFMALSLVTLSLQSGWVYNANAEGAPVTSPVTSEESPSPSASASASPSGNPITSPENPSPSTKVTNPNGGEVFTKGQTINITWEGNGVPNYTLYLVNVDFPQNPGWITTTYDANQKSYSWKIESLPGNYKVRVTSYPGDGSSISDESDNYFTIIDIPPVTSPEVSPSPSPKASNNPSSGGNNGGGNGGNSSSNSGGPVGAPSCNNEAPKSAPKIISAVTTGTNEITLTWEKAKNPVTHYVIAYGLSKGKPLYGNPNVGNVSSYTVKGLSGGVTYFFKVRAGNDCQTGAYSEEIRVKVGGKLINSPAQGFKPGVLGKTTNVKPQSTKPAIAKPVVFNQSNNSNQNNAGLAGKIFNFFKGLFN